MAPERAHRPINLHDNPMISPNEFDPFAEGNETETPPEVLALREQESSPNGMGWRVRVVPNRYPALASTDHHCDSADGLYQSRSGIGVHEVIIECPHAESNFARLSLQNIREVLGVYRDRLLELKKDRRLVHALIFKNQGTLAGASLPHSHSQLIASTFVPSVIEQELSGARQYFEKHGRNLFLVMIDEEIKDGSRVVFETELFIAFCPYASRFPFEICIIPKYSSSHYENLTQPAISELGSVLRTVLAKFDRELDQPSYNFVLHSAPFDQPELPYFQWHLELFPRLTRVAGYEWGSGIFINTVLPEDAASRLRKSEAS